MGRRARFALAACIAASAGCSLWLGLEPLGYDPPAPTEDEEATSGPDAGSDAEGGAEAAAFDVNTRD